MRFLVKEGPLISQLEYLILQSKKLLIHKEISSF
jgi:hypothetical protein